MLCAGQAGKPTMVTFADNSRSPLRVGGAGAGEERLRESSSAFGATRLKEESRLLWECACLYILSCLWLPLT